MGVVYDLHEVRACAYPNYRDQNDAARGIDQVKYARQSIERAGEVRELAGFSPMPFIELDDDALEATLQKLGGGQSTVHAMRDCMDIHARASKPMTDAFRALPSGFRLRRADDRPPE